MTQSNTMIYQQRDTAAPWAIQIMCDYPKRRCKINERTWTFAFFSDGIKNFTHCAIVSNKVYRHFTDMISDVCSYLGEFSTVEKMDVEQVTDELLRICG